MPGEKRKERLRADAPGIHAFKANFGSIRFVPRHPVIDGRDLRR